MQFNFINYNLCSFECWIILLCSSNIQWAVLTGLSEEKGDSLLSRERRQLLYLNSSLIQFNAGLATPLHIGNKTLSVNWLFQANFQLPWNRTQIPTDILLAGPGYTAQARQSSNHIFADNNSVEEELTRPDNRVKSRSEREDLKKCHSLEDELLDYDKENFYEAENTEGTRYKDEVRPHHVYKLAEDFLTGFGHNGSSCVLRAICQLAAEPLHSDDDEDILYEISQYLLSPLSDSSQADAEEAVQYARAHSYGLRRGDCQEQYWDCAIPLVDMFTAIHE